MEITSDIKSYILKSCFFILAFSVLLWFSVFLYGLLYYVYIPAVAHVKPIYLKYDTACSKNDLCKFPNDNVTLVERGQYDLLSRGQGYTVEVTLDMPESGRNLNQGVFMVKLNMISSTGEILQSSYRPALLKYRSPLFKVIYTIFFAPCLLAGSLEEKQTVIVSLFEKYMETPYQPTHYAFVEIQAAMVEIYSASLRIHAQFTGLRYFMYYWPLLSALIGIGSNFCFFVTIIAFVWVRQIMNKTELESRSSLMFNDNQLKSEIRKTMQEQRLKKAGESHPPQLRASEISGGEDKELEEEIENITAYDNFPENGYENLSQDEVSDDELAASIRRRVIPK